MKTMALDREGCIFARQYLQVEQDLAKLLVEKATLHDCLLTILRGRRADRATGRGGLVVVRQVTKWRGQTEEKLLVFINEWMY